MPIELIDHKIDSTSFSGYYFAELDGAKARTIDAFLKEMASSFNFPDYFGFNYNALQECLNDLDWIEEGNYVLYIKNYDLLLSEEKPEELVGTLKLLQETSNEWANVPNFEGEDDFREQADFKVLLEKTAKSVNDLDLLDG